MAAVGWWRALVYVGILGIACLPPPVCAASPSALPAFDLAAYRQRVASDRAGGIAEGRQVLDAGTFQGDPAGERTLLWYMGGAAVGMPDDVALGEVVLRLEGLAESTGDQVHRHYADLLRGARLIDQQQVGNGLVYVLTAANALAAHPDRAQRIVAASELCRAYVNAERPAQAQSHCREHTRLVRETDDPVSLGRAEYLEASVLSRLDLYEQSVPLWQGARQRFAEAGLDALAGRAAGSLAGDLAALERYDEALAMARESTAAAERAGNPISVAYGRGAAADALLGLGRFDEAIAEIDQAIAGMEAVDHASGLLGMLETKIAVLEAKGGQAAQVAALYARLAELRGPEMDKVEHDLVSDLEQRYRQREQALRIRELEHQNRQHATALENSRAEAERQQQALRDQRLITTLSVLVALALAAALVAGAALLRAQRKLARSLHDRAYRDALTGLPNRRALLERGQALLDEPGAAQRGHALVMVDIDHFKAINDRCGHPFGDQVLAGVGACLQRTVEGQGMAARLGGEEFVVLAPGVGREGARALAERLRAAVEALAFAADGEQHRTTISLGVAVFDGVGSRDLSGWLGQADRAVYRAKQQGRNRVAVE